LTREEKSLDDGRAIRAIALWKKNWMFARSEGDRRAAAIYSLTQTAELDGVDPQAYLREVIGRIARHPVNWVEAWLLWSRALKMADANTPQPIVA
jgi:hypothetical protein